MRWKKNSDGIIVPEDKLLCSGMLAGGYYSQGGGGGGETQALSTTITSAQATLGSTGTSPSTYFTYGYGFDAGADPFAYAGTFGSIVSATYTDGASTSRTISSCYSAVAIGPDVWKLYFTLNALSITDSDATFSKIIIDGVTRNRSDADASAVNANGGTYWRWAEVGDLFNGANPDNFEVWVI